jgi:hypothetical protein
MSRSYSSSPPSASMACSGTALLYCTFGFHYYKVSWMSCCKYCGNRTFLVGDWTCVQESRTCVTLTVFTCVMPLELAGARCVLVGDWIHLSHTKSVTVPAALQDYNAVDSTIVRRYSLHSKWPQLIYSRKVNKMNAVLSVRVLHLIKDHLTGFDYIWHWMTI